MKDGEEEHNNIHEQTNIISQ